MPVEKIRVFMVEDSLLHQAYLKRLIEADEQFLVVGCVGSFAACLREVDAAVPDVIALDLNLPDGDGIDLIARLKEDSRVAVLAVSSSARACERAIECGADDFIEKIQDASSGAADRFSLLLRLKLKSLARVRPGVCAGTRAAVANSKLLKATSPSSCAGSLVAPSSHQHALSCTTARSHCDLIALGASLGGTEATLELLQALPLSMPGIIIVQHMPPDFTKAYALRLDRNCALAVREACQGDVVESGQALVAPGGYQLEVERVQGRYRVCLRPRTDEGFCPSVDVLFDSVARAAGSRAAGVILTGMGSDGARGLARMHAAGALALGQEEKSCAVFGMPNAANKAGALDELLSLPALADRLMSHCRLLEH